MNRTRLPGTPDPDFTVTGSNNNQIAIDTWGEATDPSVILMHGGGG